MISGEISSYVCLSITLHNINISLLETNWESHCALIRLTACCLQEKNASPWRFLLCVNVTTLLISTFVTRTHQKFRGYPSLFPMSCPTYPATKYQRKVKFQSELSNGPFAPTGHMVQNPLYWMAKECGILHWDIENKGKSSLTGWNSFVFESVTFFCHPVWQILYHVTS